MDDRIAGFRVQKQGELDSACVLYCVLSAAQYLFHEDHRVHKDAVFRCIASSSALSEAMFGSGVLPAHFRALAEAAGLVMWRPRNADIANLTDVNDSSVWGRETAHAVPAGRDTGIR